MQGIARYVARLSPLAAAILWLAPASAAELEITVHNVANARGEVLVAVCTSETFLGEDCPYTGRGPARPGAVTIVVRDIPPGTYAVQAFHDENGNLDIDRTWVGIPKEGIGFSNDAPIRFGPPKFSDAALALDGARLRTVFSLRYF